VPERRLEYRKHRFPKGLLAGRSARLVVTMGMQALIYRWYFQAHGGGAGLNAASSNSPG